MKLYIYEIKSREHVLTITSDTKEDCEKHVVNLFNYGTDYGWTFCPEFEKKNGLISNKDALEMNFSSHDK